MKRERMLGAAAAVVGSIAYGIFAWTTGRNRAPLKAIQPEIAPEIAIRRERPAGSVPIVPPQPQPQQDRKFFTDSEFSVAGPIATGPSGPTDEPAFGLDSKRNEDDEIRLDDYLNLPLEGQGLTHENRFRLREAEAAADTAPQIAKFQFFRLKILATRDITAATAAIGGFALMNGKEIVYHPGAKVWNPHTGSRTTFYPEAGWSDSEQKELIVKFPAAVAVNRYRLRTSEQDTAFDPVEWRLEGSQNGLYWFPLDQRKTTALPVERGTWIAFTMRGLAGGASV